MLYVPYSPCGCETFSSVIRAAPWNGIGQYELNPPAGFTAMGNEATLPRRTARSHRPSST